MVYSLDDRHFAYANDADIPSLLAVLLSYWFTLTCWSRIRFAAHSEQDYGLEGFRDTMQHLFTHDF